MNRVMKLIAGLVGVLLVLALAIALAVAVLFDPKEFQPLLAQSVEKATGRKLSLEGDIGLDFFPCCSIRLGRATLGNPHGFAGDSFASVENAELSIRLWPLLTERRVEIGVVSLDGLDAKLQVRKDGAANWEFGPQQAPDGAAAATAEAPAPELHIGGIRIRNGQLAYRDEQDGSAYRAEQLQLDTGSISPGLPFELQLATHFSEEGDGLGGEIALQASALLDPATSRLTLTQPQLDFDLAGASLPVETIKGKLSAAAASLSFGASSELVIPALQADVSVKGRDIPGGSIAGKLALEGLALDIDKLAGAIQAFKADIDGLGARLALEGSGRLRPGSEGGAELAGRFSLDPLSPRSLLAALGEPEPQTADPKALTRLAGSGSWSLGKDALDLKGLDLRLDDSRLTGSLGLVNFDKPLTRFDLRIDQLDLDRYLAPATAGGAPAAQDKEKGKAAAAAADDIPVETLRELRLDGRIAIGKLVFAKTHLADVSATLRADGGRLRLDPLAAQLYGGSYRGSVAIDASGPKAQVTLDQQVSALQLGTILRDRYQTDKLAGALSGRISASGSGNRSDDILATLDGKVALSLADGVYQGTDLWHEIRSAPRAPARRGAATPRRRSRRRRSRPWR
jgi:AsmA protein